MFFCKNYELLRSLIDIRTVFGHCVQESVERFRQQTLQRKPHNISQAKYMSQTSFFPERREAKPPSSFINLKPTSSCLPRLHTAQAHREPIDMLLQPKHGNTLQFCSSLHLSLLQHEKSHGVFLMVSSHSPGTPMATLISFSSEKLETCSIISSLKKFHVQRSQCSFIHRHLCP